MPSIAEGKRLRSLRRRKGRLAHGLFLAEGPRLLSELLAAGRPIAQVLYTDAAAGDPATGPLIARLETAGVRSERVADRELASFADTATPQGLLAAAEIPRWKWEDVGLDRLLVLDGVQDPGNAGTLLRAAEGLGATGVVCLPGTADAWSPKVARAAAGSSLRLPVLEAAWEETRERLAAAGAQVWVADAAGEPIARSALPPQRLAIVVGNEGAGVSQAVRRDATRIVAIELSGAPDSLNVAVAGAILMDRLFRSDDVSAG